MYFTALFKQDKYIPEDTNSQHSTESDHIAGIQAKAVHTLN